MKFHIFVLFLIIAVFANVSNTNAQVDSVIGQISSTTSATFVGGISGDGRLIVFESTGNIATENPRNEDLNREIFLFDYAQRRIYQITDTRVLLNDRQGATTLTNTKVDILNSSPSISNDGRWLVFSSNATTSVAGSAPDGTNPGSFNANDFANTTQGADTLDVSEAEGGEMLQNIVQPTAPSRVQINFTDTNSSITAFSVTVSGTNASGGTITETFTFADGLDQIGDVVFNTVTSVTLDSIDGNGTNDTLAFFYGDGTSVLTSDGNLEMWMY